MKKLTKSRRAWLSIRAKDEAKRRGRRRKERNENRKIINGFHEVHAPSTFSIANEKDRKKVLRFLQRLRASCLKKPQVMINFEHTKKLHSEATVILHAEIHRIQQCLNVDLRCIVPHNGIAAQAMKKIGLLKLLKTSLRYSKEADNKHVAHWLSAYGEEVNGEKSDDILMKYQGRIADALSSDLYTGISEAMTNAHHHAYIESRDDGISYSDEKKPWWLFSQEVDGFLTVVFCDLGVGIPRSLPVRKPNVWETLVSLGKAGNDSEAISEAVKESQTRTGESNRGKGLKQIVATLSSLESSIVNVFSNKGLYSAKNGRIKTKDFSGSIMGTVISWRVPLPK